MPEVYFWKEDDHWCWGNDDDCHTGSPEWLWYEDARLDYLSHTQGD